MKNAQNMNDIKEQGVALLVKARKLKELTEQIDSHKSFFREVASGDKFSMAFEDLGMVKVATPSEAVTLTKLQFDEDQYAELPDKIKQVLIKAGVVKTVKIKKAASLAAVTVTLNV